MLTSSFLPFEQNFSFKIPVYHLSVNNRSYKINMDHVQGPGPLYSITTIINNHLIFRIFKKACPDNTGYIQNNLTEIFRFVFKENDAYTEDKDGNICIITKNKDLDDIIRYASQYIRCVGGYSISKNTQAFTPRYFRNNEAPSYIQSRVNFQYLRFVDKYTDIDCTDADNEILWALYKYIRYITPKKINEDVPKEVAMSLGKEEYPKDYLRVSYSCKEYQCCMYLKQDNIWYFRKDNYNDVWYSSTDKDCRMIKTVYVPKNQHLNITELLKGSIYEGCIYDKELWTREFGMIQCLEIQKKYLCIEQACKMQRQDLAAMLIAHILSQSRHNMAQPYITPDQSLPEVLCITGPQIKFINRLSYISFLTYHDYINCIKSKEFKKLPIEIRLKLSQCAIYDLYYIMDYYEFEGKNFKAFLSALVKPGKYKNISRMVYLYREYIKKYPAARRYLKKHPKYGRLPKTLSPSKIQHYHDKAVFLSDLAQQEGLAS